MVLKYENNSDWVHFFIEKYPQGDSHIKRPKDWLLLPDSSDFSHFMIIK